MCPSSGEFSVVSFHFVIITISYFLFPSYFAPAK
nr:MAG TPA: hypothetical protein [Bacteriophage sp.]